MIRYEIEGGNLPLGILESVQPSVHRFRLRPGDMLVMGSDKGSLSYPNWEQNLALAVKLQAQMEQTYPGVCKPIKLNTSRYNQDLSTGALLVEVGTAGNTRAEALAAAELLAEGILALAKGANI